MSRTTDRTRTWTDDPDVAFVKNAAIVVGVVGAFGAAVVLAPFIAMLIAGVAVGSYVAQRRADRSTNRYLTILGWLAIGLAYVGVSAAATEVATSVPVVTFWIGAGLGVVWLAAKAIITGQKR